jgi:predicted DCC family thiol-disulfide oxidoreductase YuxK
VAAWVGRRDTEQSFAIVPYQEAPSPPMTPALYEACKRAIHVVRPDGSVLRAGRGVLYVLARIGWHPWLVRFASWPPMIWFVELGYYVVAHNRVFFSKLMFKKR